MTKSRNEQSRSDSLGMTDRRTFLKGMAGGAVLAAGGILGGLAPAAPAAAATTSNDLTWLPAWRIRELIGKKEVSPVEVMNHFLARIEEHNPTLRAFTHLDAAGAREQAKRAEEAVRRGGGRGPAAADHNWLRRGRFHASSWRDLRRHRRASERRTHSDGQL